MQLCGQHLRTATISALTRWGKDETSSACLWENKAAARRSSAMILRNMLGGMGLWDFGCSLKGALHSYCPLCLYSYGGPGLITFAQEFSSCICSQGFSRDGL